MQGVATNFGTNIDTEMNNFYGVGSNYFSSGSFGSRNVFISSGPTSLPNFNCQQEPSLSTWYELGRKKSFGQGDGPASLTIFQESFKTEKTSADSSNYNSLGSQEWDKMIEDVILNELVTLKESVNNKK